MNDKIKRFFTEYSREKILALFLTLLIWLFMISGTREVKDFTVAVEVTSNDDIVLVSEIVEKVHVKVSGSLFAFARIREEDLKIKIDISTKKPGIHTRFLDSSMMPFGDGIKTENIFPSELVFKVSKKAEKVVSVEPWLEGQPPLGWKISGWSITPEQILVEGPENEIEELEIISTERIFLSSIKGTVEKTVKAHSAVPFIKPVEDVPITVKIELERDMDIRMFSKVPINLDSGKEAEITPLEISFRLKGPKDILQKMEQEKVKAYIKDQPDKKSFKTDSFYIKDLHEEVELLGLDKALEISVIKK